MLLLRYLPLAAVLALPLSAAEPLPFEIKTTAILREYAAGWQWFHPRPAAIPGMGRNGAPLAILTIQKHLGASDHFSGISVMSSDDLGKTWKGPVEVPELKWVKESETVDIAVADVTPGWHRASGKILAVGAQVRYDKKGTQLEDRKRSHQTAFAVFDPKSGRWTPWKVIPMPPGEKFDFARSACAQWLEMDDGTVLLPFYYGRNANVPHSVTVAQFRFDGKDLHFVRQGSEHHSSDVRGLVEPSIVKFQNRYYLTIRNDLRGYVTVSDDGLNYAPVKEWRFDDGGELGSYNTQAHWLAHSDGLFLSYTRKGANNDHVFRHRAPLFIAQVDPQTLRVMRRTEKILMPDRGATLGNFGAAAITPSESWVTDTEGMFFPVARQRGAEGATWLARVVWSKPNRLVQSPKR